MVRPAMDELHRQRIRLARGVPWAAAALLGLLTTVDVSLSALAQQQPAQTQVTGQGGRSICAHPLVSGSVMNDDNMVVPQTTNEPDCSPYPFDILAIYALYQGVN